MWGEILIGCDGTLRAVSTPVKKVSVGGFPYYSPHWRYVQDVSKVWSWNRICLDLLQLHHWTTSPLFFLQHIVELIQVALVTLYCFAGVHLWFSHFFSRMSFHVFFAANKRCYSMMLFYGSRCRNRTTTQINGLFFNIAIRSCLFWWLEGENKTLNIPSKNQWWPSTWWLFTTRLKNMLTSDWIMSTKNQQKHESNHQLDMSSYFCSNMMFFLHPKRSQGHLKNIQKASPSTVTNPSLLVGGFNPSEKY